VVDINPHLHSRSVSEDKRTGPTSGSGNVTPKREVSFLERGGGEKERGKKQGNEVNVCGPCCFDVCACSKPRSDSADKDADEGGAGE
jgi:hypothetical protein